MPTLDMRGGCKRTKCAGSRVGPAIHLPFGRIARCANTEAVHATASMEGRITLEARHTLAQRHRSSKRAVPCALASFSASSATSIPILFRCLKQSATVLATLYTCSVTPSRSWVSMPCV